MDIGRWSAEQVASWMKSLGKAYETYMERCLDNGVTGVVLLRMTGEEFCDELEVRIKLHRIRIMEEIKKFRDI